MQRPIKFRAWDKLFKEMFDVPMLSNKAVFHAIPPKFMPDGVPLAQVELMQYTGLKDKNGKEIYEGDIVKVSGFSEPMEVYFKDGYFGWGKEHRGMYSFDPFGTEDLEVIGNIYENTELIGVAR